MPKIKKLSWGEWQIKENGITSMSVGDMLEMKIRRVANEVWISTKSSVMTDEVDGAGDDDPDETMASADLVDNWSRWALNSSGAKLNVTPIFPSLPVIVMPEYTFRLKPGSEARFFTRIPVWIQVADALDNNLTITEIPVIVLSRTWFGSFLDGELCYWLKTTARRYIEDSMFEPHLCTCPIQIKNVSDEELLIDKICVRVERLGIYRDGERLWSDEMSINYRGGKDLSDIVVSGNPPPEAKNAELIGKPRNPQKRGIAERTFKLIHDLQGIF